jgi:hypothetical protein
MVIDKLESKKSGRMHTYRVHQIGIMQKVKSLCLINEALRHEDVKGNGCIDPRILDLRH